MEDFFLKKRTHCHITPVLSNVIGDLASNLGGFYV